MGKIKLKYLTTICCAVSLLISIAFHSRKNRRVKFTNQYYCTIEREPQPLTADEYFKRAVKHLERSNYSENFNQCAFDAVSEGLKLDPQADSAFAIRGKLYLARAKEFVSKNEVSAAREDFESALEDLNEAIRIASDRLSSNRSLYYKARSEIYQESVFLDPDSKKTLQDLTKAIELAENEERSASAYAKRGDIYFNEKKDYENAVKDYTEAVDRDPKNAELYSKRSQAYDKLGKEDLSKADNMKVSQLKNEKTAEESSNERKIPKTIFGGVLTEKAINLPKPEYPEIARIVNARGGVKVEVTVDENGNVISAEALTGNPVLRFSAAEAAKKAKFKPTLWNGQPVKVTGFIIYDFTP